MGDLGDSRDGLPWMDRDPKHDWSTLTRVYGDVGALPTAPVSEDTFQLETNVQLLELGGGAFCVNHALRQSQLFGGRALRDAYRNLVESRPVDERVMDELIAGGFVVPPEDAQISCTGSFSPKRTRRRNSNPRSRCFASC